MYCNAGDVELEQRKLAEARQHQLSAREYRSTAPLMILEEINGDQALCGVEVDLHGAHRFIFNV